MPAMTPPPGTDFSRIVAVEQPAGEGGELEEGHAGVEQAGDALARQELAALGEERPGALARRPGARLDRAPALDQAEGARALRRARFGVAVEGRQQRRHQRPFSTSGVEAR